MSDINRAIRQFRRYLKFVDDCLESFEGERGLNGEGLDFVYLVDFQEIYAYLAPLLWTRGLGARTDDSAQRFFATSEFFDHLTEKIYLPLGTIAELTSFLKTTREKIRSLYTVASSTSADRAIDEFLSFFASEKFLSGGERTLNLIETDDQAGQLLRAQAAASLILKDFEAALQRLHALVTHPNLFSFGDTIRRNPVFLKERTYRDILSELARVRDFDANSLNNKADAFNISFALTVNAHYASFLSRSTDPRGQGEAYFFKVLTDTRSLFRLQERLEVKFTYQNFAGTGFDVDLLDRYDEALYKRRLAMLASAGDASQLIELASKVRSAKTAYLQLTEVAREKGIDLHEVMERVQLPGTLADRQLVDDFGPLIAPIADFFVLDSSISRDLRDNIRREELLEEGRPGETGFIRREFEAQDVERLELLVGSIQNAIAELDTLKVDLREDQRQVFPKRWNPTLSLYNLGFESTERSGPEGSVTWELRERQSKAWMLRVDLYGDFYSAYWPSAYDARGAVNRLLSIVPTGLVVGDVEALLTLIDRRGGHREISVFPTIDALDELLIGADLAFLRLDLPRFSFVAELFTADASYDLKTGIISAHGDVPMLVDLFLGLSTVVLPRTLLKRELGDVIRRRIDMEWRVE